MKVFSICGYTNKVKIPHEYEYDSYFCTRSSSWGWGTWADRWNSVDWELRDWKRYSKMARAFNKWGGSDCFKLLRSVKDGQGNSWAIRFCFSQFLQDKLSLFPTVSKVKMMDLMDKEPIVKNGVDLNMNLTLVKISCSTSHLLYR